jgi:hypothetical protein
MTALEEDKERVEEVISDLDENLKILVEKLEASKEVG